MATRVMGTIVFFNTLTHEGVLETPSRDIPIKVSGTGAVYEDGVFLAGRWELQIQRGRGQPIRFNRHLYVGDVLLLVHEEVEPELPVQTLEEERIPDPFPWDEILANPPAIVHAIRAGYVHRGR